MAVIALMVLVIGPKDSAQVLRSMAHWMRKIRAVWRASSSPASTTWCGKPILRTRETPSRTPRNMNVNKMLEDVVDPTGEVVSEEARNEVQKQRRSETTVAEPGSKAGEF